MIFPTKRLKKLFHLIHGEGQEQAWTSQALADRLEVTVRTIRDDLKKLDHILAGHGGSLESKRGRGYSIRVRDAKRYTELLEERKDDRQKVRQYLDRLMSVSGMNCSSCLVNRVISRWKTSLISCI